jgi:hypothetical protein
MFKRKKETAPKPEPRERTFEEFEMHHEQSTETFEDEEDLEQLDENDLREVPTWEDHEETAEEAEERHRVHLQKKRNDKIFNNSYNTGDGPEYEYSGGTDIKLSPAHADSHLHDPEKYRDHLDFQIIQNDIQNVVEQTPEILAILASEPNKKKYSKTEINTIFSLLKQKLHRGDKQSYFVSPIQIMEAISNLTMLEYKKLFDMLEYEYKEDLIKELKKTHKILDRQSNRSRKLF